MEPWRKNMMSSWSHAKARGGIHGGEISSANYILGATMETQFKNTFRL
jgi:hypothetical protein